MAQSELEEDLWVQLRGTGWPLPVRQFPFLPPRKWRADFAWPTQKILVEVHGGIWSSGRHTRGSGFQADRERQNEATLAGWRVLEITDAHIKSGQALTWIERALALSTERNVS